MPSFLDAPIEATDQENTEGSEKYSNSSSEEANKISKDCIEDDALNASITHAASNDLSSSSSEGDLLPIFQTTMRRLAVPDDLPAKTNEEGTQLTNFHPESKCEFLKEWNATCLWWDSYKQQANESRNNQQSIEEQKGTREDPNTPPAIDEDGELQISSNFKDISIPFIPRNAKSLPSPPVKPHEVIPLSEYGGRAEQEEAAP